jgi:LuxR family transcriptional regulator, maltose regulon positive regulatory protein
MSTQLLATKLYVPRPRPNLVLRQHLIERLNAGLHRKMTLVSAPAGFGKTTLVSDWVADCGRPTAWLSLDEGDNDPTRFLTYLVTALQTIAPTLGEEVLDGLRSPQPAPTESLLTALLNEINTISHNFVLVLDDYHVIDATPVDQALSFLLEHLSPQMHLVITTREDPPFPLARLRARGQLTELRAADLRFSPSEAAQFLNQIMRLGLSAADIAALDIRTEGWIAGLQLAALSVQGHQDVSEFIRAFAGDNRYIVDYLVEEVLERQPDPVRSFLLQTAILDRLNGPLCDAVTGQEGGQARLEALERGNFFVVPLDDKRHWYRYHHLFADVLYTHLMEERPDQVSTLHRRASEWYEHQGSVADAIRHAMAAKDFERAAGLIEQAVPAMFRVRQEAAVLGWLQALPDEFIRCRPVLSDHYAGALLSNGKLEGVETRLQDAERWLDTSIDMCGRDAAPAGGRVVEDQEAFRQLPGSIALHRAGQALVQGNLPDTVTYAQRVLDLVPEDNYLLRGGAAAIMGLASWTNGDLEAAHQSYAEGMADLQRAGNIADTVGGAIALADIRIAQGRLHDAMRTYEQALRSSSEQGTVVLRGTADIHVGMSAIYRERNDLHTATQHLLRSKDLGEHIGFPQNPYRWRVAMARMHEVEGDLDRALDLLQEAEHLYIGDFSPNVRPVPAMRARIWIRQGRLGEAFGWARTQEISVEDDLHYLREFEHITLVRLLMARAKSDRPDQSLLAPMRLLERLLKAAEDGGRTGSVIEILLLLALVLQMQQDIPGGLKPLARALALAEPEGYVRLFVDEGEPMAILLQKAMKQGIVLSYVRHLLSAFGKGEDKTPVNQYLAEPLSERELAVLRLFATDLSGPEIARELIVSLSTLRTHTQNIYTKLGVNSRRAAVRQAEDLNLL